MQERLVRVQRLARLLDSRFRIGKIRVGWDALLGLIPGVGELLTSLDSAYILLEALLAGVPPVVLVRMTANVAIENLIGWIPLLGDLFDIFWKANERNARLFEQAVFTPRATQKRSKLWLFFFFLFLITVAVLVIAVPLVLLVGWLKHDYGGY